VVVAARDAAQTALRELNTQLEKRVLERTRELHAKNQVLEHEMRQRAAAEQELLQKQELLDAVLESVDVAWSPATPTGKLTLFNRAAREFHGSTPATSPAPDWQQHYGLFAADGVTALGEAAFRWCAPCAANASAAAP
jgi:PAS domain-containing protein